MHRISKVIGKPIVAADTGDKLGTVADLLIDPDATHVVGLVIAGGVFSSEHVLPYTAIATLGTDAVVTHSGAGVLDPREWREQGIAATRSSALKHRRVMTEHGRDIGTVNDIFLEDGSGRVEAYEVGERALAGLVQHRRVLPHAGTVTIGPDAIVMSEQAATVPGDETNVP